MGWSEVDKVIFEISKLILTITYYDIIQEVYWNQEVFL